MTSASFLLHVVFINLFVARAVYNNGGFWGLGPGPHRAGSAERPAGLSAAACQTRPLAPNLPGFESRVPTGHSILLAALVGPLGVVSHVFTKVGAACRFGVEGAVGLCLRAPRLPGRRAGKRRGGPLAPRSTRRAARAPAAAPLAPPLPLPLPLHPNRIAAPAHAPPPAPPAVLCGPRQGHRPRHAAAPADDRRRRRRRPHHAHALRRPQGVKFSHPGAAPCDDPEA
jgi:hypothetical protein